MLFCFLPSKLSFLSGLISQEKRAKHWHYTNIRQGWGYLYFTVEYSPITDLMGRCRRIQAWKMASGWSWPKWSDRKFQVLTGVKEEQNDAGNHQISEGYITQVFPQEKKMKLFFSNECKGKPITMDVNSTLLRYKTVIVN